MITEEQQQEEKYPDENIDSSAIELPANDKEILDGKSDLKNMEVHHHPKVEKKNFKEYLLEGFMIFIAVTMGFFAESFREHLTDNAKEREFIISMKEDAATDTANIRQSIIFNKKRIDILDTLATYCFDYNNTAISDKVIYNNYLVVLSHPDFVSPTERTLLQLKNSGGMRLIKKKNAIDKIITYDNMAKKLADQLGTYERYQNESVSLGFEIFNFKGYHNSLRKGIATIGFEKLITHDKVKLIELGNRIVIFEGVVRFYVRRLEEMNKEALELMKILDNEYHLKDE